ncbi:hypothetical protein CCMA1212_008878 [Trichoderma ghanense]|uniref:Secreted protein n=1 Tax=Trichoderma ghanense TaxID=65468 RepID=A0ABY2GW75_9HYPO
MFRFTFNSLLASRVRILFSHWAPAYWTLILLTTHTIPVLPPVAEQQGKHHRRCLATGHTRVPLRQRTSRCWIPTSDPSSEQVPGPRINLSGWPGRDLAPGTWGGPGLTHPPREAFQASVWPPSCPKPYSTIRCCHCTTRGARQTDRRTAASLCRPASLVAPLRDDPRIRPEMPGCLGYVRNTFSLSPTNIAL